MEDLNKNQIVLLTILISFVTSIATGIMTTSLLQQAPIEVTRNINRVVEKTIETVVPQTILTPGQKEVTTVIVKEEDLVVDSINKNVKSIVRILEKDSVTGEVSFYGMGLVISKDGQIISLKKPINSENTYSAKMSDETVLLLSPQTSEKQTTFALFKVNEKTSSDKPGYAFSPVIFSDIEPKLGQTIISIGGDTSNAVAIGRTVSLNMKSETVGTTTTKYLSSIETDVSTRDLLGGSPLINLNGDLVGIKGSSEVSRVFLPISVLKKDISVLTELPKNSQN